MVSSLLLRLRDFDRRLFLLTLSAKESSVAGAKKLLDVYSGGLAPLNRQREMDRTLQGLLAIYS